jgi:DNA primase
MFPIFAHDDLDLVAGWAARNSSAMTPEKKWRYTFGLALGQHLYNLARARGVVQQTGQLIVVEGLTDTLRVADAGFDNVAAVFGASLSDRQADLIREVAGLKELLILSDNDEAGDTLARKVSTKFMGMVPTRRLRLPEGIKDVGGMPASDAKALLLDNGLVAPHMGDVAA